MGARPVQRSQTTQVDVTAEYCREINCDLQIEIVLDKFKRSRPVGNTVFCCVDSIVARKHIWDALKDKVNFFVDGRMSVEVIRIVTRRDSNPEGYAYCRSKVYGAKPGKFYDGSEMSLYMPKGLASSSNVQINYLSARGKDKLYLMLTNQSKRDQTTTMTLDPELLNISDGKEYPIQVWKDNKPAAGQVMKDGKVNIEVSANGMTAIAIGSIDIEPVFQNKLTDSGSAKWAKDQETLDFGGCTKAVLFNFGADLQSVYTYTKANGEIFKEVTLHYANDGKWQSVTKGSYPFEFTVDVPGDTKEFKFRYEAVTVDGEIVASDTGILWR